MRLSPLNKQAMALLSERLTAAEEDAHHLAEQLSLMASNSSFTPDSPTTSGQASPPPRVVSPFEAKGMNPSSDALTSRLCRAESAVTTLKYAMTTLQQQYGDNPWSTHEKNAKLDNQVSDMKKQQKEEMGRLRDEMICLQQELTLERESKLKCRSEVQKLQDALMEVTQIRSDTSTRVDQLEMEKQKHLEKITTLDTQLEEERKSRENLEISHLSLLNRIEQMESIIDCEKNEVEGLTSMYDMLQQETEKSKMKLKEEQKQRVKIERSCHFLLDKKNKLEELYEKSEESNKTLLGEIEEQRQRHAQLMSQLEELQHLFERQHQDELKLQNDKSLLKEEISNLKSNIQSLQTDLDKQKQELVNAKHELEKSENELKRKEENLLKSEQQANEENVMVKEQIVRFQKDKVLLIKEKEELEIKIQLLQQETTAQNVQLENKCKHLASELQTHEISSKRLLEDYVALQQKMADLERQKAATQQIDEVMKEMLEQKKKLSYEKGNLQSQVQQLQSQVQQLQSQEAEDKQKRNEFKQLTRLNKTLQNKCIKIQNELQEKELNVKDLSKQVGKFEEDNTRKMKELQEMTESQNKLFTEVDALKCELKNKRNKHQQKMLDLQKTAENSKTDNKKLAETLQAVIKSHNRLESSVDELQMVLGRKDNEIDTLRKQRSTIQKEISDLQREFVNQQQKLMSVANAQTDELGHARASLLKSKEENKQTADSLQEVLNCNRSLQQNVEVLMAELKQKIKCLKEIKKLREKEEAKAISERNHLEEQLDSLREELHKEREQNNKKSSKEVVEVKRQNDRLLGLNGELSRSNSELRHKILGLHKANKEYNEKLQDEKRKSQHLQQQLKENNEQIKMMRIKLQELQKFKQEEQAKNNDQLLTIEKFQNQVSTLQLELSSLTVLQTSGCFCKSNENVSLQEKDETKDDHSFDRTKQRDESQKVSSEEEYRKLVRQESEQISENLKAAKEWFANKFDELQKQLIKSKKVRQNLENGCQECSLVKENEVDRTTKSLLKSSESSLKKLAEFADEADFDTKIHLTQMPAEKIKEKTLNSCKLSS